MRTGKIRIEKKSSECGERIQITFQQGAESITKTIRLEHAADMARYILDLCAGTSRLGAETWIEASHPNLLNTVLTEFDPAKTEMIG